MSQRELARSAGVSQPAIARIEGGAVTPGIDTLERMLAAAGATHEISAKRGVGVDRTLIREALRRSPDERIVAAGMAGRNLAGWRREAGRARQR